MITMESRGGRGQGPAGRVLYVGQAYYNAWYLSRALRELGWKADVLNIDWSGRNEGFYHGEDFRFERSGVRGIASQMAFFARSLLQYDVFHFSNAGLLTFGGYVRHVFGRTLGEYSEVRLLKKLGKKIVYSNNGCSDGVSQSSFRTWGPVPVCDICPWRDMPSVCSDERNLAWGRVRNELADYQVTLGGNRKDYNDDPRVHEVPEFYCLDPDLWDPDLMIPANYRLPFSEDTVKIYHSVANFESRTRARQENIKSTHIYLSVIERLKAEGYKVELIFFHDVPNKKLRYYQAQADLVVDMLTFGFYGANVREAMMLGKPSVCFLRPEWLASMRREIPDYVDEMPVVSATPDTVYAVLKDLLDHPEKRRELGRRSRQFALKWHSAQAGARRMSQIYGELLGRTPASLPAPADAPRVAA